MTSDRLTTCLALLREADDLLLEDGEILAATHLSLVIELLADPSPPRAMHRFEAALA